MPTDVIIEPSSGQIYWNDSGGIGLSQSISIAGNAADQIRILGYGFTYTLGGSIGASTERVIFNDSLTSTIKPGANASGLGDATNSWDVYAYNSFFRQPALFQSTNNSTSLFTGSIQSDGGIGVSGNASIGQSLNIFNSTDGRYFVGFRAAAGLAATNLYTLPTNYPGTGTSVLASDTNGTMTWVPSSDAGGGSGTTSLNVNVTQGVQDTSHRVLFTPSTTTVAGAALSSNNTLVYNPSTNILTSSAIAITATTAAGSTSTGALTVAGGVGIGGSLWTRGLASFGGTLDYATTNMIANFTGDANSYTQIIVHNHNSGNSASSNIIVSNDSATDSAFYGDFGMNSSGWAATTQGLVSANAVYLASANGDLVLGTYNANALRVTIGSSSADTIFINNAGTAISINSNIDLIAAQSMRFLNSGNTFFTGLKAGANAASYTLTLPSAPIGAGASVIVIGSDGNMFFAAPGGGIAFSSAITNTPIIRAKRPIALQFSAGFTPAAAGADTLILRVPESPTDGTTVLTYHLKRFQARVETPSAGSSRLQLERSSTDTGTFTLAASGSSHIGGFGVTISGAGIFLTSVTTFSGSLVTSGNLLRLNWNLLNATHANFSVQLLLEEV